MRPRVWPALVIEAPALDNPPQAEDRVAAILDDYQPQAIEDLVEVPLPAGGLWDAGRPAIPESPPSALRWRVFFTSTEGRAEAAQALRSALPSLQLTAVDVVDEDWARRSQQSLRAVTAGRFVIAPPWDVPAAVAPGMTTIVIEPSMGFGTGHHATTRLCLRLLSEMPLAGLDVVDVGTGSGVLAMAAALGGARSVLALDIDDDAIHSARASADLNPLPSTLRFEVADFRAIPFVPADVVLANLTGGLLRASADALTRLVAERGALIVSGFELAEAREVRAAFAALEEGVRLEEEGWVALRLES